MIKETVIFAGRLIMASLFGGVACLYVVALVMILPIIGVNYLYNKALNL